MRGMVAPAEQPQYTEDRQHLTGVSTQFASQVDLALYATNGEQTFRFPVHRTLLSAYSSVLGELIEATLLKRKEDQTPDLMMVDDSCSALRSALACIYTPLTMPGNPSPPPTSEPELSLTDVPIHASHMKFYDKYGMRRVAQTQTEAMLVPLRRRLRLASLPKVDIAQNLDCAAAAREAATLVPILAVCEVVITRHFPAFALRPQVMAAKLSSASMLRVAQGWVKIQQSINNDLKKALDMTTRVIKRFCELQHYSDAMIFCPGCYDTLTQIEVYPDYEMKHDTSCSCTKGCKWPDNTYKQQPLSMDHIIADAHEISTQVML